MAPGRARQEDFQEVTGMLTLGLIGVLAAVMAAVTSAMILTQLDRSGLILVRGAGRGATA